MTLAPLSALDSRPAEPASVARARPAAGTMLAGPVLFTLFPRASHHRRGVRNARS